MFTTKPRPAPSKAALRVLYQLAYISSGTAVGAGVLCAEERRRRTQIVQHIADNARKIRQHPRYVANAALAVKEGDEGDDGHLEWARQAQQRRGKERNTRRETSDEEAVKGPYLPSVVEDEFDAVSARKRRVKTMRNGNESISSPSADRRPPEDLKYISDTPQRHITSSRSDRPLGLRLSPRRVVSRKPSQSKATDKAAETAPCKRNSSFGLAAAAQVTYSSEASSDINDWLVQRRHILQNLEDGRISEAVQGYREFFGRRTHRLGLFYAIFDAALKRDMLAECVELARLEPSRQPRVIARYRALIRACHAKRQTAMILDLFCGPSRLSPDPIQFLSESQSTLAILAVTCIHDGANPDRAEMLYGYLDEPSRAAVVRQLSDRLRTTWHRTRNLESMERLSQRTVELLGRFGDSQARSQIDGAMAEIYIRANCTSEALQTIARMHRHRSADSLPCMLLAAYMYARQHAWGSLHEVLQMATTKDIETAMSRRERNNIMKRIILHYAIAHSASETWKFVGFLQDSLRYEPNGSIHRLILRAFVTHEATSLIPRYLRSCKVDGSVLAMDSRLAAQLLTRYYEGNRPSHVLMMWFCRNLCHLVPEFDPQEFHEVIIRSIAFDLSGQIERNAPWQQAHARERLERILAADKAIPSPGYKYDKELFFQRPNGSSGDPTSEEKIYGAGDAAEDADLIKKLSPSQKLSPVKHEMPARWHEMMSAKIKNLGLRMQTELDLGHHEKVLQLYEQSLDEFRAPQSPKDLIAAVQASLKLYGHDEYAHRITRDAQHAGINVLGALSPILVHQMRSFDRADPQCAARLQRAAVLYYEMADQRGFTPEHDVGASAANLLITSGHADSGVRLLAELMRDITTRQQRQRRVNDVFLAVMMKGCVALGRIRDVVAWAHRALRSGVRISPGFMKALKHGRKTFTPRRERAQLAMCVELCSQRRKQQAFKAKILGKRLVATIARCARKETTVEMASRTAMDEELFGPSQSRDGTVQSQTAEEAEAAAKRPQTRRERIQARNSDVAKAIRYTPDSDSQGTRHSQRLTDVQWMRQYRAFLRMPMVLEDGRYASFRFQLPSESTKFREGQRRRRARARASRERFSERPPRAEEA